MNEITRSSEPSVQQMLDMAANLKEKFDSAACIELVAWHYSKEEEPKCKYTIFVGTVDVIHRMEMTWEQCQDFYFELMRG